MNILTRESRADRRSADRAQKTGTQDRAYARAAEWARTVRGIAAPGAAVLHRTCDDRWEFAMARKVPGEWRTTYGPRGGVKSRRYIAPTVAYDPVSEAFDLPAHAEPVSDADEWHAKQQNRAEIALAEAMMSCD